MDEADGTMENQESVPGIVSPMKKLTIESDNGVKRDRKQTEKGKQYQEQLADDLFNNEKKNLEKLINVADELVKEKDIEKLREESNKIDVVFNNLLAFCERKRNLTESD